MYVKTKNITEDKHIKSKKLSDMNEAFCRNHIGKKWSKYTVNVLLPYFANEGWSGIRFRIHTDPAIANIYQHNLTIGENTKAT